MKRQLFQKSLFKSNGIKNATNKNRKHAYKARSLGILCDEDTVKVDWNDKGFEKKKKKSETGLPNMKSPRRDKNHQNKY